MCIIPFNNCNNLQNKCCYYTSFTTVVVWSVKKLIFSLCSRFFAHSPKVLGISSDENVFFCPVRRVVAEGPHVVLGQRVIIGRTKVCLDGGLTSISLDGKEVARWVDCQWQWCDWSFLCREGLIKPTRTVFAERPDSWICGGAWRMMTYPFPHTLPRASFPSGVLCYLL